MDSNIVIGYHAIANVYMSSLYQNIFKNSTCAFFLKDRKIYDQIILKNTLKVLVYHGVSLNEWKRMGDNNVEDIVQYIDQQLNGISIVKCNFEKSAVQKSRRNFDRYVLNTGKTLPYLKLGYLAQGSRIKITDVKKVKLMSEYHMVSRADVDTNRFFYKERNGKSREKKFGTKYMSQELEKICTEIAERNLDILIEDKA